MKKNIVYIFMALVMQFGLTSCDDFLTQVNNTDPNLDTFFDSDEAVFAATAPLYNYVWYSFNDKFYYGMGDGRSGNINAPWSGYVYPYTNFTETALSEGLEQAWGSLYSVVAQSNNAINNIRDKSGTGVTQDAKEQGIAEARFMRGLAYWYIASLWGKGIIYENTAALVNNSVVPPHRRTDVIEFAIRDLEYAAKYLPRTGRAAGRLNRYSAFGMLSRVYLSMAGLTTEGAYNGNNIATDFNRGTRNEYYLNLAKEAALKVVNESSFRLMDNYGDLFKIENNNNSEAMFQLQWLSGNTDNIGWGCNQSITSYFGWSTMVSDGTNWGGATFASWDLVRTYKPEDVKRRHATIATYGAEYPEMYKKGGGYIYGVTEAGNDYLQRCCIRKYVVGTQEDNGVSSKQSSGINTNMLRLAEVYLNLVEAIMGNSTSTTDATARTYFNMVRQRAGMPLVGAEEAITYSDINYERRIELAVEGQYWYDLVRRAYYRQNEVIGFLNSQERNAGYEYDAESTEAFEYKWRTEGSGASDATANSLVLPISDVDNGKNPLLAGEPIAYEFDADDKITDLF
ncbi:RagB/SusD family nutrient uptake outer membrane protein [Bacteroides sp. 519]|uniref:RagB/SusD family nutrient uptake outer membrane protein n=1 Tax=Bacteroides sp. 519 TaxID=2302937 RepID=UPI0013D14074|nr:RagB/SusD family nutrient uptake outer membrane protein [Bacteroides sp. 519]NDV60210.1 RagB/SusD family nutrient uptake outer membrane protein [Bacteroides sp. 519]